MNFGRLSQQLLSLTAGRRDELLLWVGLRHYRKSGECENHTRHHRKASLHHEPCLVGAQALDNRGKKCTTIPVRLEPVADPELPLIAERAGARYQRVLARCQIKDQWSYVEVSAMNSLRPSWLGVIAIGSRHISLSDIRSRRCDYESIGGARSSDS